MVVERWYENVQTGAPFAQATEGDLVRVRLRLTVRRCRGGAMARHLWCGRSATDYPWLLRLTVTFLRLSTPECACSLRVTGNVLKLSAPEFACPLHLNDNVSKVVRTRIRILSSTILTCII